MDKRNTSRLLAAALALALLSGCGGNTGLSSQGSVPAATQSAEVSAASGGETAEELAFATIDTEDQPAAADSAEETDRTSQPTEQCGETEDVPGSELTEEQLYTAEQTEAAPEPEVTSAATTAQTTSAAPVEVIQPTEPVKVVIPDIKVPLSPGVETTSDEKAVLDYSNAAEGYISVSWKDSGKLVKLRLIFGDKVYDHDVTPGKTEYFPLSCGSGTYKAQLYEQTEGNKFIKVMEQEFTAAISRETSPFLYPNKYVDFSAQSAVVKKAAELCAGKTDTIEKLAAVFQWITDNVTYDKQLAATVQDGYVPDPDSVLAKKSGICFDYASLLAAMIRSQGIPARLVVGYASPDIYHAWNEVYTEETGWITPELLLSKYGYNLLDSTFYAGYSDKNKAAEYISNGGNYSALYYY